jgi:hypothetical protein
LGRTAAEKCREYRSAFPYPHITFENFLPEATARAVRDAFPGPDEIQWTRFKNAREVKLASNQEVEIPPAIRNVLYALNSATFLKFLEELTGIDDLIPDPQFVGGGMHQIVRGGKLGVHVDFNKHPHTKLDRRLNLLIYLNEDWEEEYGGHFELWDPEGNVCCKRVLPVYNRCVIFSTTEVSYHGHPTPLQCPPGWSRKSIALYYYSNGRPAPESAASHSTVFIEQPTPRSVWSTLTAAGKTVARELTPPVFRRLLGR